MCRKILIVLMGMALAATLASAQTTVPGGNVSGTWDVAGSPYEVEGEITVPTGETLTIEPGVTVEFQGHHKLIVNGYLEALGVEGDSILFTAADTTEGWHGIRFLECPDSSHMFYCIVQYGRAYVSLPDTCYGDTWGGGIFISGYGGYPEDANPVISHCLIRWCEAEKAAGIEIFGNPTISYCDIMWNTCTGDYNGGIGGGQSNSPVISYCNIVENSAAITGGGIGTGYWTDWTISHCTISGNWAGSDGGGIFMVVGSTDTYDHCVITGNSAGGSGGGVLVWYLANPVFMNCTITDNYASGDGGGIHNLLYCSPTISNCIVEGNTGNGGMSFVESPGAIVTYCDFHDNENGHFKGSVPEGLGVITGRNANGDVCDDFFNIFKNPKFVDPENGFYQLRKKSPCIDAGDPGSPLDPDNTIADIGAFYYAQGAIAGDNYAEIKIPDQFSLSQAYPNPFNPTTTMQFTLPEALEVNFAVYDISGRKVMTLIDGWRDVGNHQVTFDGSALASGVYFYKFTAGQHEASGKMVLMK